MGPDAEEQHGWNGLGVGDVERIQAVRDGGLARKQKGDRAARFAAGIAARIPGSCSALSWSGGREARAA